MENTAPGMHAPMAVNVTVDRPVRPREYLTEREIEKLIKAAGENRWGHRDAFEWVEEGKPYREWLVPAAVLNDAGAVRLLDKSPINAPTLLGWLGLRRLHGRAFTAAHWGPRELLFAC